MHPNDMNREQRRILMGLNNKLFEIEKQIKKEGLSLIEKMEARVADADDWIGDYEIECRVDFYLNPNDPAYCDEKDNILATITEYLKVLLPRDDVCLLGNEESWNELGILDFDTPDKEEHHCRFYHALCEHCEISWEDILRIGDIWVDINLNLQHHFEFPR
jgi:hypothetical protein